MNLDTSKIIIIFSQINWGTVPKYILENRRNNDTIDSPDTRIQYRLLSWLSAIISMKNVAVKKILKIPKR